MKPFSLLLILLLLTSCGAVVTYDYEKNTDFTVYKTYNYYSDLKTGFSDLDTKRIVTVLDAKLKSLGFTKSENPSFNIDIQSLDVTQQSNNNIGVGVGGTGRSIGGGISIGIPIGGQRALRELKIEFVDDSKTGVFWEAVTTVSVSGKTPEKREQNFAKSIEKVFSKYPPSK